MELVRRRAWKDISSPRWLSTIRVMHVPSPLNHCRLFMGVTRTNAGKLRFLICIMPLICYGCPGHHARASWTPKCFYGLFVLYSYRDYRLFPCSLGSLNLTETEILHMETCDKQNDYSFSLIWWRIMVARLAFVLIFIVSHRIIF